MPIVVNKHGLRVLGGFVRVPDYVMASKFEFVRANTEPHPRDILRTFWEGANNPDAKKWKRIDPPKDK